jgi:hypothetical protein
MGRTLPLELIENIVGVVVAVDVVVDLILSAYGKK